MRTCLIVVYLFVMTFYCRGQDAEATTEQQPLELDITGRNYPFSGSQKINEQRLAIASGIKNQRGILAAAYNLGQLWLSKEDYRKALDYFGKAESAAAKLSDEKAEAILLAKTGFIFHSLKMPAKALEKYNKAGVLMQKNKMTRALAAVEAYTAQHYLEGKKYPDALKHFERSASLFKVSGDSHSLSLVQSRAGEVCLRMAEFDKAINLINAALPGLKTAKDTHAIAAGYRDAGLAFYKKGDYEEALDHFNNSIRYDDNLEVKKIIKNTYLKLAAISGLRKDSDKASEYNELYIQLRDSINSVIFKSQIFPPPPDRKEQPLSAQATEILRTSSDYKKLNEKDLALQKRVTETELEWLIKEKEHEMLDSNLRQSELAVKERDAEIQSLQKQQVMQQLALSEQQLKLSRQSEQRNLLLAGTVALLFGLLFFVYQFRAKKKKHEELNKTYSELEAAHHELKEAQQQLIRQEKLASLGQLTAGIAHEIKNPLNFVNNFSQLSSELVEELVNAKTEEERTELGNNLKKNLEKIHHHGHRADCIVKNMLEHARSGSGKKEPVELIPLMDEYIALAYHGMRAEYPEFNCEIKKDFDPRMPKINCVQQDVARVFLNILSNAFHAVKDKQGAKVEASIHLQNGKCEISIQDNGKGIPAPLKEKIFEPFFTTKSSGEGTGLGLSISYDIIKSHGGEIKLDSKEGEFTRFTVQLPANA